MPNDGDVAKLCFFHLFFIPSLKMKLSLVYNKVLSFRKLKYSFSFDYCFSFE